MRQDLADLNEERDAGQDVDPDVVNRLFRSAHTLKELVDALAGDEPWPDVAVVRPSPDPDALVDLAASDQAGRAVVHVVDVGCT